MNHLILKVNCPDKSGIVGSVTNFIYHKGGNIIYLDQHVDVASQIFFMRVEVTFPREIDAAKFSWDFSEHIALPYQMNWKMQEPNHRSQMAIFVSKYQHCLYDLLSRYRSGEFFVHIPFVLSNHKDLEPIANQFGIPFFHVPVTKDTKKNAEQKQLELLKEFKVDCIVLARYMQIISQDLIAQFPNRIINIHHSFLPAFAGAKPYHAAFERGVKIIGATSHYVTEELDAGPIIEQDVTPVSHIHTIKDFIAKGRDLEKIVLARAVKLHLKEKTMVYGNKTVIFS